MKKSSKFMEANRNMMPTRIEAERLLREAEQYNPVPWENHSRIAAHCAEK